MEDEIEFFRTFSETDYQARHAMYADPDDERFLALARSLDAMYEERLRPRLRRALNRRATQYAKPDYVESAVRQQRRPIFAVARYEHANIDVIGRSNINLYRAWTGAPEIDPRGDGIVENLYAAFDVHGQFKIRSVYRVCGDCLGAEFGAHCRSCSGVAWQRHHGPEWLTPVSRLREVRMLRQPSDPRYQATYDAIQLLDRVVARIDSPPVQVANVPLAQPKNGVEFFRMFSEMDYQARHAMYADPDDVRFLTLASALDAVFEEGCQPRLRRMLNRHAAEYTKPDYVEAAGRQQRRSIFAVARYQHANIDLYRAWTGSPESDPRGEGITENLYAVRDVFGRFKIHSVYRPCDCLGAVGERCERCSGDPWQCQLGTVWLTASSGLRDVLMLKQPSDSRYQPIYDAIRLLERIAARRN